MNVMKEELRKIKYAVERILDLMKNIAILKNIS